MKKLIATLVSIYIIFIYIPVSTVYAVDKDTKNLYLQNQMLSDYLNDYNHIDQGDYNQNTINEINSILKNDNSSRFKKAEFYNYSREDIKFNEAFRIRTSVPAYNGDIFNSKENFLKAYRDSREYSYYIPIKDGGGHEAFYTVECKSGRYKIIDVAETKNNYGEKKQYEEFIRIIKENNIHIKDNSEVFVISTTIYGLVYVIISDDIDYVIANNKIKMYPEIINTVLETTEYYSYNEDLMSKFNESVKIFDGYNYDGCSEDNIGWTVMTKEQAISYFDYRASSSDYETVIKPMIDKSYKEAYGSLDLAAGESIYENSCKIKFIK